MRHIKDIRMYLKALTESEKFHMLILESAPGWGKSTTVNKLLGDMGIDAIAIGSYSTPLFLYNALVTHPRKTIILDDCAGLFNSPEARAILKAATWPSVGNGERRVTWCSTGGTGAEKRVLAPEVNFQGRLILLVNFLPSGPDVDAFKSRSYFFRIKFTKDEIADQLLIAAKNKKYFPATPMAMRVAKHLIKNLDHRDPNQFNFRTLAQGYELAKSVGKDWPRAVDGLLPEILPESILRDLVAKYGNENGAGEKQFREMSRLTGISRRQFQRLRAATGIASETRALGQEKRHSRQS